jgi:hypothetical protein
MPMRGPKHPNFAMSKRRGTRKTCSCLGIRTEAGKGSIDFSFSAFQPRESGIPKQIRAKQRPDRFRGWDPEFRMSFLMDIRGMVPAEETPTKGICAQPGHVPLGRFAGQLPQSLVPNQASHNTNTAGQCRVRPLLIPNASGVLLNGKRLQPSANARCLRLECEP